MSFLRKNARRLRDLRRQGVPINGNNILTGDWGICKTGDYIDPKTQKEWLTQLRPDAKVPQLLTTPRRLLRGRSA